MSNKICPICGSDNSNVVNKREKYCSLCGWDLSFDIRNFEELGYISSDMSKQLKYIETWSRKLWENLLEKQEGVSPQLPSFDKQKKENSLNSQQSVDTLKEEIEELKQKISQLEQDITELPTNESLEKKIEKTIKRKLLDFGVKSLQDEQKILLEQVEKLEETSQKKDKTNIYQQSEIKSSHTIDSSKIVEKEATIQSELNGEEKWIIKNYFRDTNQLLNYLDSVALTENTINDVWMSKASQIIFEESSNDNEYWIFHIKNSLNIYLVPSHNLIINENNKKILKYIFKLNNFSPPHKPSKKILVKPARVTASDSGNWKLIEKGILDFAHI